ncbi:SubName: Full=Uncharacterized protein {ECO:0000313/EMBL:CCA69271.1} [Serendipita indica DSM 11827]|uniref:N-acetyltransferase domain-containing protein n=1 Tax=Serendipita indica (strain DSM 11827) TaxID=1109443 RepID=G4TD90_SERID|nr:SubName: Full=Uncharacterized protein {ECO:0000313/EMBL:CCA69271.1} [Serendipita indica DSM 11827]CCA69271.1 hypothetical protein PIIN_03170 [Serendipita indica DSM 11827]
MPLVAAKPATHVVPHKISNQTMDMVTPVTGMPPTLYYRPISMPPTVADLKALQDMRVACGWYLDRIPRWLEEVATNRRFLWFIHFGTSAYTPGGMNIVPQSPPIGMISLYLENPDDPTLACFSLTSRVEITSLFVYASYRHLGVGAAAIQEMERRAKSFGATHTTFNTMATERHLRVFKDLGYHEFKPRSPLTYSVADVVGVGMPASSCVAAFLEKAL